MAFAHQNLSVLAYANGFNLYHYTTSDDAETIHSLGYFNEASNQLRTGDIIMTNFDAGEQSHGAAILLVSNHLFKQVGVVALVQTPNMYPPLPEFEF